ncbi:helix-turn-helix domain-containing protein [Halobacteriovorax sp.]|uniref:helix-turn-helix domain-containing protein n=1 Tax=Halobacteriovorax sp. TaxID=2020862 RepID=UPI003AF2418C
MEQDVAKEAQTNEEMNRDTLGSYLKKAREEKKLGIEAVSSHTRINITNLSALEADDVNRLPNIAYVRGFVKTLSKTYDIDENKAINLLEELYGQSSSSSKQQLEAEDFPQAQVEKKQDLKPKSFEFSDSLKYKVISLVGLISIGIFIYININKSKEVDSQDTSKEVVLKTKAIETTQEPPVEETPQEETQVAQEETAAVEANVEEKEEVAAIETKVPEEEKTTEKKEEAPKEINFYNLPSPLFGFKEISDEERNELIPENIRNSYEDDMQNVFLRSTSGDSWVVYKKDDEPIKAFTLKEGRYVFIKGQRVIVRLGNINAMHVFYNNDLLGMTSRSGVKSLVFPVEIAKEYKLPLFIFNKDGSFQTSKEYIEAQKKSEE